MGRFRLRAPARHSFSSDAFALILTFARLPIAARLAAATAAVAVGLGARFLSFGAMEGRLIFITLLPAVAAGAVVGGLGGGVLAALLSALAAHFLRAPIGTGADLVGLASFLISSAMIVVIVELLRIALRRLADARMARQSEMQLEQFVEQAPAAMAMLDREMRCVAASARWRDDFQLGRDIVGKSLYEIFPGIPDHWKEIHKRALGGETLRADKDAFHRADGTVQWLRWEIRPWRFDHDDIGGLILSSEDVSARVQAEEAAKESSERLNMALAAANAGVWEIDVLTGANFWSDEIWGLCGLPPHSVTPSRDSGRQTIHPADRSQFIQKMNSAMAHGDDMSIEWRVANVKNERWLMLRGGPLAWEEGRATKYGGVLIDITARKKAEQETLAARAKLEAALSSMTDAVYIISADGSFVHVNDAYARFFRFRSKQECAMSIEQFLPILRVFTRDGQEVPPDQWPSRRGLAGETVTGAEYRAYRKDTGDKWVGSLSFAPIRDAEGAIVGSVTVARDITEQVKGEEALRDSERRFKAVYETSMDAIAVIDSHGTILSINPELQRQFGYAPEETVGANIKMLMPPEWAAAHDEYLAAYLRGGEPQVIGRRRRVKGLRKDGTRFPLELAVAEAKDGDTLFIGFMRDLTDIEAERRKAEAARAELLHVARLSDMGEVSAGLAHEVSQPLTAIVGLAAAARRSLETAPDTPLAASIDLIETQARQAVDILRRLRGFIEKRESQRIPESLTRLVQDALALATVRVNDRSVRIVQKLSPDDIDVNVDRVQILQVLVNFLRNAADAMSGREDPEITVETATPQPGFVRVRICDNGAGIDPAVAERLFTPFVTTKPHGMGVGLSLCKSIIQNHAGEIGCSPNTPRGAVFWFALPMVARQDAAAEPPQAMADSESEKSSDPVGSEL